MKKIAFISACLMLFAFGKTWAQGEVHVFADNAFSVEIFNGDPASTAQMTDFGAMPAGSPDFEHVFTIQNQGIGDLDITDVTITPGVNFAVDFVSFGPLPPFLPTTFAVTFSYSTAPVGIYDATVTIESNDPNSPFTFAVRAEVTSAPPPLFPEINLQGNGMDIADGDNMPSMTDHTDFGSIIFGNAPVVRTFTIQNNGDELLNVTDISLTGAGIAAYTLGALDPASPVAPLEYAEFTVTFDPAAAGSFNATVEITNDDPDEATYTFAITGSATTPPVSDVEVRGNNLVVSNGDNTPSTADGTDFGITPPFQGHPINHFFVITNTGADPLNVANIYLTQPGTEYEITSPLTPASPIPPGNSASFIVSFVTNTNGPLDATVTVDSDEPDYTFLVRGRGETPAAQDIYVAGGLNLEIINGDNSPNTQDGTDLGPVAVGSSASSLIILDNFGSAVLHITDIAVSGTNQSDFTVGAMIPIGMLPPGEIPFGNGTTFSLNFNPSATGLRQATITLTSDDPDENPYIFNIQGTGTVALSTWYEDADGDTYGNPSVTQMAASQPTGFVSNADDCDDTDPAVNPAATEVCNGMDDDCDGQVDEGVQTTFFADADGDGFGNAAVSQMACTAPAGFVSNGDDCDDTNAAVNPAATEVCNGIDDDCDGLVDEGVQLAFFADSDGDGFGDPLVSQMSCTVPAGFVANDDDCDDSNFNINPSAPEVCNGIDDDCDGQTDEGVQTTFFADADNDGFGDALQTTMACTAPAGFVANNDDCDDTNPAVNPAATEVCNGIDDDCDGQTDEGVQLAFFADMDGDGFGDPLVSQMACAAPAGFVADNTDCDDTVSQINLAATEVCNGLDDDCNGLVDTADPGFVDTTAPSVTCMDFSVALGVAGSAAISPNDVFDSGSDNCGTVNLGSMTVSPDLFSCANVGTNTVTLTALDLSGNAGTCTAIVTVTSDLVADAGADVAICEGDDTVLGANGSGGNGVFVFAWNPPGGLSANDVPNPVASPSSTMVYVVTVTDGNGCFATDSVLVEVKPLPTVAITGDGAVCLNETTTLTATGGADYLWSTGETQPTITVGPTMDTDFTVMVSQDGCSASHTVSVTVHPLPVADAGPDVFFCEGTAGVQLNGSGGVAFEWSPVTDLNGANTANPLASPPVVQVYSVLVTDVNGCTGTDEVLVVPAEKPTVEAVSSSPICTNEDLAFFENGGQAATWSWSGPGGFSSTEQNPVVAHAVVAEGVYSLVVSDAVGCNDTVLLDVVFSPGLSFEAKFLVAEQACMGDTVHFIEISDTDLLPDTFLWNFGDGVMSNERDPLHVYGAVGSYQISVTVSEAGCDNFSIEKGIQINNCRLTGGDGDIVSYQISPNITSGEFRVAVDLAVRGPLRVEVFDAHGRRLESCSRKDILRFDELFLVEGPGVYFVVVRALNGMQVGRVVVARV